MSKKTNRSAAPVSAGAPVAGRPAARTPGRSRREEDAALAVRAKRNSRLAKIAGAVVAVAVVAIVAVVAFGTLSGSGGAAKTWTNITTDQLASMMNNKDFTLLNVKTPYIGEIDRTDLYIPYTELTSRAGELPADKGAKIVVYCRTGNESAIASQTLLDMGYTNIWNLSGGMVAWQNSGRTIVQKNRS